MVESKTMVKPRYVTVAKNGKVTCNDCPGWNAYKICSHSLAVAEKNGRTADYLKCLRTITCNMRFHIRNSKFIALNLDNPTCLQPQLVATNLQHSNSAFVNSSCQCNQPSGATYPSMVYARSSSSQSCGGSSHAYGGFRITFLQLSHPWCVCAMAAHKH